MQREVKLLLAGEDSAAGFTLLELLVVLAIMGLLLLATPALISSARPGVEAKTAAQNFAYALRNARIVAINTGLETSVLIDATSNSYQASSDKKTIKLASNLHFNFANGSNQENQTKARIQFFPDGSSSGGAVKIVSQTRQYMIKADWLTGQVSLDE